ncbi:MAG: permease, partial [Halapricum sp.]
DLLGGFVLIGLMAFGFVYLTPDAVIEQARENVEAERDSTARDPVCGMDVDPEETEYSIEHDGETYYFCSQSCMESFDPDEVNTSIREQATSLTGWKALADKQYKEWGMLWDEIALGFVFAGLIAGFVPEQVWTTIFSGARFGLPVYVFWTAILGAVVGIATFVCSVGNVPF